MRRAVKWAVAAVVLAFVALQFRTVERTNPSVDPAQTLEQHLPVPAEVKAILERSCRDCHSHRTEWPMYSYIAPLSWDIVGHVNRGREEVNFSQWGGYDSDAAQDILIAICKKTRAGDMPLPSYTRLHWSARLSADDVRQLCIWTSEMRTKLREGEQGASGR